MIKHIKSIVSLTLICAVVSVLLALTNNLTSPIIKEQENAAVNESLSVVFPNGQDFSLIDLSQYELPETITEIYSEKSGGYVFKMTTAGYGTNFVLMCGINKDGIVTGATYISSNETLGVEKDYGNTLKDKTIETIDNVETISGATRTTGAYKEAIKDALNSFTIINGGTVDLRDETQILNDNLNAALPQADGKFTSIFIADDIGEFTDVYSADNGAGYVLILGETFIATDKDGNVLTETNETLKANAQAAIKTIINSSVTEIDITKYQAMPTQILKAYKTNNGNYVFELRASGFGINGDKYYNPSGEYIYIKASATKDGKIISCITESQKETDGIGSACGEKSFYSQFNGKTEADYSEIDAISGATITTNGYKTAISKIFAAIKILEGVS